MNTITQKIYEQLGGNKFVVMTGAKEFCSGSNMLQFRVAGTKNKANLVQITLMANDTYMMQFYKLSNLKIKEVCKPIRGIYCDQLQNIFQETTGLYISL